MYHKLKFNTNLGVVEKRFSISLNCMHYGLVYHPVNVITGCAGDVDSFVSEHDTILVKPGAPNNLVIGVGS